MRPKSVNLRKILIICGSLVVAGGAFVYLKAQNQAQTANVAPVAPVEAPIAGVKVLVAKKDLAIGERINAESLSWAEFPNASLGNLFITEASAPDSIKFYTNAIVKNAMVAGEPVIATKLVAANGKTSLMAAIITPGMRATSVNVSPDSSVAGFILPDSRVDIILTRAIQFTTDGQQHNKTVASTILENVRVLAIDQKVAPEKDVNAISGATATVELSSSDAEKLKQADSLGDISLVLRSYADGTGPTISRTNTIAMAQPRPERVNTQSPLSSGQPDPNSNTAAAAPAVKIYRGGQ